MIQKRRQDKTRKQASHVGGVIHSRAGKSEIQ